MHVGFKYTQLIRLCEFMNQNGYEIDSTSPIDIDNDLL